ncbi:hypothetical protein CsSME_00016804 [Camellia sinensis var. sinensis]
MPKGKFENIASFSSTFSHGSDDDFQTPPTIGSYIDPLGKTWYGTKRHFHNKPLFIHDPWQSNVGHVIVGHAYDHPPHGVNVDRNNLQWQDLFEKRCELEIYCRWHGLRVPRARSAELCRNKSCNDATVISRLQRENTQMQRRLDRFHYIKYAKKKSHFDCDNANTTIIEDLLLVSDPDISDFSDDSDDDFVNYLPNSLCVRGKPFCCYEHGE